VSIHLKQEINSHRHLYPDPFAYITLEKVSKIKHPVNSDLINNLLDTNFNTEKLDDSGLSSCIRRKHLTRLVVLWHYNQLNNKQTDKFAELLWEKRDTKEFPINTTYCEVNFLKFPYPKKIKQTPIQLLEKYIDESDNWYTSHSSIGNGIEMTRGISNVIVNILGTSNEGISYKWDKKRINNLLIKILNWWENDKKYLLEHKEEQFFSIAKEFKTRFLNMISLFIYIFMPNIALIDKKHFKSISILLKELPNYKMNDLAAKASFLKLFPNSEKNLLYDIKNTLLSQEEERMLDALGAIIVLVKQGNKHLATIISIISQKIKFRTEICLNSFLCVATIIVKDYQQYLNKSFIDDVNIGLEYLLAEVKIDDEDEIERIHKKLENIINGIKLILVLKKYFKNNKLEIPTYMEEWEKRCLDKNEFSEVRNAWKNNE